MRTPPHTLGSLLPERPHRGTVQETNRTPDNCPSVSTAIIDHLLVRTGCFDGLFIAPSPSRGYSSPPVGILMVGSSVVHASDILSECARLVSSS